MVVVDGDKPAFLGRNWLTEIKLDGNRLFVVIDGLSEELLKKHRSVFDGQHDIVNGFKADLLLNPITTGGGHKVPAAPII